MRHWVCCLAVVLSASLSAFAAPPKPTGDAIVSPDAKLELLFTRTSKIKGGLTEGPTVAPDGSIYFSDIPFGEDKGMILRFDPKTKKTTVFKEDSKKSNGLKFDTQGRLNACEGSDFGGQAVVRYDIKTGVRTVLADKFEGKKFNAPNDLVIDREGRIYFSDPKYLGTEKRELEHRAVYRVDPNGSVIEITHEVEKPNGVALSPDGKTLYVADHNNGTDRIGIEPVTKKGAMKVYAFPLGADGKVSGPRKTLYDFGTQNGCDGMTIDSQGHIYLTSRGLKRPGVLVLNPEGKEVAFIPTGETQPDDTAEPVGVPSNVTFGIGDESKTLYITVDKSLYRIGLKTEGFRLPAAK
ncbi:MAG: Gluconolactonase [Planctomycetaceae bacterium]|nr:Gluconolactonase [Planctomycetaceae bacterium]